MTKITNSRLRELLYKIGIKEIKSFFNWSTYYTVVIDTREVYDKLLKELEQANVDRENKVDHVFVYTWDGDMWTFKLIIK